MSECLPGQIQTPAPSLGTPSFLPPTLIKLPQVVLLNFKCPHTPLLFECAHTYPVPCSEVNTGHSCNLLAGFHFPLLWGHLKGHCVYTHTHTESAAGLHHWVTCPCVLTWRFNIRHTQTLAWCLRSATPSPSSLCCNLFIPSPSSTPPLRSSFLLSRLYFSPLSGWRASSPRSCLIVLF